MLTFPSDGSTQYTSNQQSTWTVPQGVTSIIVEVWGGGGGGTGRAASNYPGAGGGGGAYARKTYTVTPGQTLYYQIGQKGTAGAASTSGSGGQGGQSYVKITGQTGTAIASANGGNGASNGTNATTGGSGSSTTSCSGGCDQVYSGGGGKNGGSNYGGGGGGGAGSGAGGTTATNSSGTGGGGGTNCTTCSANSQASLTGGNGGASGNYTAPGIRGGGGSGGDNSGTTTGQAGGGGLVRISYCSAPGTQASSISASSITSTSASINWTNGNGTGRVVYINTSNSFTNLPINNPTANTSFSSGPQCIFNGTGSGPVSVTGLTAGQTYYVRVYEYSSCLKTYNVTDNVYNFTASAACSVLDNAGSVSGDQTICSGGNPAAFTSSADASGGSGGTLTYQWESSTSSSSSGYTDIITNGTSATYDPPAGLTTTTYYRRKAKRCSGSWEVTSSVITVTVNALPAAPSANNGSRCGTGMVAISATPGTGETIDWYGASSGGSILTTGTPNPAQGTTSFTTQSISTAVTYYAEARNSTTSCVSSTRTAVTASINTAAYRSAATGNWSDATKWEVSCDGTNWSIANVAPGSGDGAISIRNGHNITVAASTTIDELTIDEGATLTVNASQTLTIANGTGDDLTVNGSLIINGSVTNSGAIKLNSGGLYNHANGTSIPNGITFAPGSTLEISGSATCTNIHSYASRPHHLTWSSSGAMPTGTTSSGDALTLCSGDFTLSNGSFLANNNGSGSNYSTVSIGGNLNLSSSGILRVIHNSNGSNSQGVGQINITGNFNMTGGTFDFSNSSNATTGAKLNISGNFTHTAGSITATTQPSTTQINLTGTSGTQIIESTGQSCSLTFNVAGSNAQCLVAASKTFIQSANTTFIVADGTSTPDLLINGTFNRTGTSLTTTGTMSVASGGTYQHNCNGHALPSATWDASSTCNITGTSSTTPTNFGQTFGNLTVNCSGTTTTDANSTVAGNLTITGGTLSVGNNFTLGITGNSSITGTLTLGGSGVKTFTGNSTINSSGTLNVSGSGAYSIAGNFTNNGTFSPGTAILSLNGGGTQTLDGSSALTFSNITINKSGGTLTAAKDITITGTLTLTSGILDMNSKTLTIGTASANGTISGGSATSYVVAYTDGINTSKLIHRVNSSSNTQYVFPIGTSTKYTPVQLTLKGGTLSSAQIEVYTKNGMVTGMNSGLSCHLNRSWFVEPVGITSPSYDIQLNFASGDFSGDAGFDLNPIKLSGGVWYKPSGSLLQNGTTQGTTQATTYSNGSNPSLGSGTVFWSGLSSFSEFGGGGGGQPLPVELLSFSANCNNQGFVDLTWQTASEYNSSHFDVEKSRNGSEWQVINTIPAAGNSNELLIYQAADHANSEIQYYRLNQVDIDGTNKYYNPIAVHCDDSEKEVIQTYPNPSNEGFSVLINNPKNTGDGVLTIVDATGAIVSEKSIIIQDGANVFFIQDFLTRGVYFIQIEDSQNKTLRIKHTIN